MATTSIQKSSTTCSVPLHTQRCTPSTFMKRQTSEIRIVLNKLEPKCGNDSAILNGSLEIKTIGSSATKQSIKEDQPSIYCKGCMHRKERRFFSLSKTQCRCEQIVRRNDENEVDVKALATKMENPNSIGKCSTMRNGPLRIPFSDFMIRNSPIFRKKELLLAADNLKPVETNVPVESGGICRKSKMHYIFKDEMFEKKLPVCSTPKIRKSSTESGGLNLLTPPADARYIDSENESQDEEQKGSKEGVQQSRYIADISSNITKDAKNDTAQTMSNEKKENPEQTLVKCFSLTRSSCRSLTATIRNIRLSRTPSSAPSSPKSNRHSLLSITADTPSPLRRQKNVKKTKNFNLKSLLNIKEQTPGDNESNSLSNESNDNDDLGCTPLLTKENIERSLSSDQDLAEDDPDRTLNWGDKFEFSFICEPSNSDTESEDELDHTFARKAESFVIPEVKVTTPKVNYGEIDGIGPELRWKQSRDDSTSGMSPFRRSISDPSFLLVDDQVAWPKRNQFIKIDGDNHVTVYQANVVHLNTLNVSLCYVFFCLSR